MSDETGAVKSIDIMTLRMKMVRMEKMKSFLAQSRSSGASKPDQAIYSQDRPNTVATAKAL